MTDETTAGTWQPIPREWFGRFDGAGPLLIAAFDQEHPGTVQTFRARGGEHGALFEHGSMLSLNEQGWVPYAWCPDDTPMPDDEKWPPMWSDYLTEGKRA